MSCGLTATPSVLAHRPYAPGMSRPKRTARSVNEWVARAADKPIVGVLLQAGDDLRAATTRRESAMAEEKRVVADRKKRATEFQAKAEVARTAVLAAAE